MIKRRRFIKTAASAGLATLLPGQLQAKVNVEKPPADQGFHFPHEAGAHERTFMQWPVNRDTYGSRELSRVQSAIGRIARTVSKYEPVTMLAEASHHSRMKRSLGKNVDLLDIATDDLWARDSIAPFLMNKKGELALAELNFNGWGEKQDYDNDGFVSETLGETLNLPVFNAGLVGEGGGIEQDGEGTLIAHESSWINENRNPFSGQQVDTLMRETLAAKQVIWAPGLKGQDITDYHIDTLAKFIQPGLVLMQLPKERGSSDLFEKAAWQTYDRLIKSRDAKDRKLEIVVIHGPDKLRDKSDDFVSSYVNFYVCNGAVIAPRFGDDVADGKTRDMLEKLFPGRVVDMINIDAIARNGGGIHCATREMPKPA